MTYPSCPRNMVNRDNHLSTPSLRHWKVSVNPRGQFSRSGLPSCAISGGCAGHSPIVSCVKANAFVKQAQPVMVPSSLISSISSIMLSPGIYFNPTCALDRFHNLIPVKFRVSNNQDNTRCIACVLDRYHDSCLRL
jgi:hypothetical protein